MARRPVHYQNNDPLSSEMEKHIVFLGFVASHQYQEWCRVNGFSISLEKSKYDLQEERERHAVIQKNASKQARIHKNPKAFLTAVCSRDILPDQISRPNYRNVAKIIDESASHEADEARESLLSMLLTLLKHDDLLFETALLPGDPAFIFGLLKLHDRRKLWLRPLEDWKPKSKNSLKKFGELTHYLLDDYGDVPVFMEKVWLRSDKPSWRYRDWFIHLGRGHNLRKAKSLVPVTKKIAHNFRFAPDDYSAEQAIRRAQMMVMNAGQPIISAVVASRLGNSLENEEFWTTVLRFLADHPMLDPAQVNPIVDYLQAQKFTPVQIEIAPGEWHQDPPPQPGLSMAGRTVDTLLRQVNEWHVSLGKAQKLSETAYDAAEFKGADFTKKIGGRTENWKITQLRTARDLLNESQDLHHCVSSYHYSCAKGLCSIWSLSKSEDNGKYKRILTLEVNKARTLVQCRGLANRLPTNSEWDMVKKWTKVEELFVAPYLN